MSKEGNVYCLK